MSRINNFDRETYASYSSTLDQLLISFFKETGCVSPILSHEETTKLYDKIKINVLWNLENILFGSKIELSFLKPIYCHECNAVTNKPKLCNKCDDYYFCRLCYQKSKHASHDCTTLCVLSDEYCNAYLLFFVRYTIKTMKMFYKNSGNIEMDSLYTLMLNARSAKSCLKTKESQLKRHFPDVVFDDLIASHKNKPVQFILGEFDSHEVKTMKKNKEANTIYHLSNDIDVIDHYVFRRFLICECFWTTYMEILIPRDESYKQSGKFFLCNSIRDYTLIRCTNISKSIFMDLMNRFYETFEGLKNFLCEFTLEMVICENFYFERWLKNELKSQADYGIRLIDEVIIIPLLKYDTLSQKIKMFHENDIVRNYIEKVLLDALTFSESLQEEKYALAKKLVKSMSNVIGTFLLQRENSRLVKELMKRIFSAIKKYKNVLIFSDIVAITDDTTKLDKILKYREFLKNMMLFVTLHIQNSVDFYNTYCKKSHQFLIIDVAKVKRRNIYTEQLPHGDILLSYKNNKQLIIDSLSLMLIMKICLSRSMNLLYDIKNIMKNNNINSFYLPSVYNVALGIHIKASGKASILNETFFKIYKKNTRHLIQYVPDIRILQIAIFLEEKTVLDQLIFAVFFRKSSLCKITRYEETFSKNDKNHLNILMFFYSLVFILYCDRCVINSISCYKNFREHMKIYMLFLMNFDKCSMDELTKYTKKLSIELTSEEFLKLKNKFSRIIKKRNHSDTEFHILQAVQNKIIDLTGNNNTDTLFYMSDINKNELSNISVEKRCTLMDFILNDMLAEAMWFHSRDYKMKKSKLLDIMKMIMFILYQLFKDYEKLSDGSIMKEKIIKFFNTKFGSSDDTLKSMILSFKEDFNDQYIKGIYQFICNALTKIQPASQSSTQPQNVMDLEGDALLNYLRNLREENLKINDTQNHTLMKNKSKLKLLGQVEIPKLDSLEKINSICYICHGSIENLDNQQTELSLICSHLVIQKTFKIVIAEASEGNSSKNIQFVYPIYNDIYLKMKHGSFEGMNKLGGCGHVLHSQCLISRNPVADRLGNRQANAASFKQCDLCSHVPNLLVSFNCGNIMNVDSRCTAKMSFATKLDTFLFFIRSLFEYSLGNVESVYTIDENHFIGQQNPHYIYPPGYFAHPEYPSIGFFENLPIDHIDIIISVIASIQAINVSLYKAGFSVFDHELSQTQKYMVTRGLVRSLKNEYSSKLNKYKLFEKTSDSICFFEMFSDLYFRDCFACYVDPFKLFCFIYLNLTRLCYNSFAYIPNKRNLLNSFGNPEEIATNIAYMLACVQNIYLVHKIIQDKTTIPHVVDFSNNMDFYISDFQIFYQKTFNASLSKSEFERAFKLFIYLQLQTLRKIVIYLRFLTTFNGVELQDKFSACKEYFKVLKCLNLPSSLVYFFELETNESLEDHKSSLVRGFSSVGDEIKINRDYYDELIEKLKTTD